MQPMSQSPFQSISAIRARSRRAPKFLMKPCIAMLALALVLGGCSTIPSSIVQYPTSSRAPAAVPLVPTNGSIFQASTFRPLFEDRRARLVGDLITIVITENTNAVKAGASSGSKTGTASVGVPKLFQSRLGGSIAANSATTFADGDNQSASNVFTGTIGVSVLEVLPNGNLVVAGEKQVAMNKGVEFIRFSGVINPDTIVNGNTVASSRVADARVEYRTNSQIDAAEMTSMVSRFFLSLSPF
jgi:flagellar L-ring protein precursor FlgH